MGSIRRTIRIKNARQPGHQRAATGKLSRGGHQSVENRPFERIEPYDLFFTKERYALRALEHVGLKNLHYLPLYCVPDLHHIVLVDDGDELSVMRNHPKLGFDSLQNIPGTDPEILDMVLHHHEYLDGSGYPEGLSRAQLSDLVRLITIADVYGALIERRSYKLPMSPQAAYEVLENMGPKLDADLVREFHACTRLQA